MPLQLPTLLDILKDRSLLDDLPDKVLAKLVEDLSQIPTLGAGALQGLPESPAALAVKMTQNNRVPWEAAPHLALLSEALVKTIEEGGRLLVSMPPRHGKSELISHWLVLWFLARNPTKKVILASYEADFAAHWGRRVRNAILDVGPELGLQLDGTSTAANRWSLTAGGGMVTAGADGPITGRGADLFIIDDPIKNMEEAQSPKLRENLWDWYQTAALTRVEPGGAIVIVGTRWHQDDLIGRLEEKKDGIGVPWEVIKLPAFAEADDPLGREKDGPLWPERISRQMLQEIKDSLTPYNWSALYQQRPTPEGQGSISRGWWKHYAVMPAEFDTVIQSWDLAFKDLTDGSYTVGQVWGRRGAEFFLLDQIRGHFDAPTTLAAFRQMWSKWPQSGMKLVEDKANGPAIIALLHKEIPGIVPVQVRQNKQQRLSAVAPMVQAGNVYIPHLGLGRWVADFIEEAAGFPNAANDDQVDAMSQALTYLQPQAWRTIAKDWAQAKLPAAAKSTQEIMNREFFAHVKKKIDKSDKKIAKQMKGEVTHRVRRVRAW